MLLLLSIFLRKNEGGVYMFVRSSDNGVEIEGCAYNIIFKAISSGRFEYIFL